MRARHFNFAVAVAVSAAAHLLLWPAALRLKLSGIADDGANDAARTRTITLVLNDASKSAPMVKPKAPAKLLAPPPVPRSQIVQQPDEMGAASGHGTGAQPAKGEKPLIAEQADQEQAFLSRDPVGSGRVGDPPTFNTGPRGEDGAGGRAAVALVPPGDPRRLTREESAAVVIQRPGSAAPNPHPSKTAVESVDALATADRRMASEVKLPDVIQSPVHGQQPEASPPADVAPPPALEKKVGAAPVDLTRAPVDAVKARTQIADATLAPAANLHLALEVGPPTSAVKGASTSPPTGPKASVERAAVVMAPKIDATIGAAAALPPPQVDAAPPRPPAAPTPPVQPTSAAQPSPSAAPAARAVIATGDNKAPGRSQPSADPAQESDSESDPFTKLATADVLRDGRVDVRIGRKIKTTRPHLLPGAMAALYANPDSSVVLKMNIDATGKVVSADIIRSSGSIEIDQPCRVAVYDWWVEPSVNKAGKPVPDVLTFTFRFH